MATTWLARSASSLRLLLDSVEEEADSFFSSPSLPPLEVDSELEVVSVCRASGGGC
jgi:hypothetical protein